MPLADCSREEHAERRYLAVLDPLVAEAARQDSLETLVDVLEDNFELARYYLAGITRGLIAALDVRYRRGGGVPVLGIVGSPEPTGGSPGTSLTVAEAPEDTGRP